MNKLKCLVALALLSVNFAQAANFPISAGASTATIQSTINTAAAAGGGNTVTFAAGSYSITSQISIPCPSSPLTIQGPTPSGVGTSWPVTPTANLTGTLTNNWGFTTAACSTALTIQYLHWNGGEPAGGGGGFLHVTPGTNNLSVIWNWLEGNQAIQTATQAADDMIWLDGVDTAGATRTQNATIRWNRFGTLNSNDCSNLMNVLGSDTSGNPKICNSTGLALGGTHVCYYQASTDEKSDGGYCGGVGIHVNTDNLLIGNNTFAHLEQPLKFFEDCGFACTAQYYPTNLNVNANDFQQAHRITLEAQQHPNGGGFNVTNNDEFNQTLYGGTSWGISVPQGNGPASSGNNTLTNNNVLIENNAKGTDRYGIGASRSEGIEDWGNASQGNHNLIQGLWASGVQYDCGGAGWTVSNDTIQLATTYFTGYVQFEGQCTGLTPPTQTANVTSHTIAAVTSVAPTILPVSGSVSFPLTVTLSDPGYTSSSSLPQGNTGIWYTIDGSTPVPGAGTAQRLDSGGTFSLASAATVKAVGMWGALNQPTSYPSGYGFVPSSPVTATYTGGGAPTLTGGFLSTTPINGVNTMTVGGATVQMAATGNYSDGSTGTFPSPVWTSNNTPVCTIGSSSGIVTAVAGGFCSINAQSGSIHSSSWGITVGTVGLTSGLLCKTGSASGGLPGPGGTNPTQGIACHP